MFLGATFPLRPSTLDETLASKQAQDRLDLGRIHNDRRHTESLRSPKLHLFSFRWRTILQPGLLRRCRSWQEQRALWLPAPPMRDRNGCINKL